MSLFDRVINNSYQDSFAAKMRRKRFKLFQMLLHDLPKPLSILDVGGTQQFWEVMGFVNEEHTHITLLNLNQPQTSYENFLGVEGDATNMFQFVDKQFDVVFSNSVIEHVGSFERQKSMALEVLRVGKRYFVQTPNYYFPMEPHFLVPGFHWFPTSLRVFLITHWQLGWYERIPDPKAAWDFVEQIRLLRRHELLELFPNSNLYEEKLVGLTKSLVVYGGW